MHEVGPLKGLREICPVEGCEGDARYFPPGKGHKADCYYPHSSQEALDAFNLAAEVRLAERAAIEHQGHGFINKPVFLPEPMLLESEPSQESKIIISLLMRIYDVQMALLTKVDPDTADKIYDAHERGEDFNPTIYIPEINDAQSTRD